MSVSVLALTSSENYAAAILSRAVRRPNGVVDIFRLTICHFYTGSVLAPDTATLAMLRHAGRCEYIRVRVGVGATRGAMGEGSGCGVGLSAVSCLELCLVAAAVAISRSEVNGRGVNIAGELYVGVAFAATVLRTSLVRFATRFRN